MNVRIPVQIIADSGPPSVRRFAEGRAGNLERQRARNLRALQTDRRARCWGRPGCTESPVLVLIHQGESLPFAACLPCGERLLLQRSFRPFDGPGGHAA